MEKVLDVTLITGEPDKITVRKLALGDYGRLFKSVKKLPTQLVGFIEGEDSEALKDLDLKKFIPQFLPMVGDAFDELCEVLAVPTDKDGEYFATKIELADAVDVLVTALELNDYSRVVNSIKKLTARKTTTPTEEIQTPPKAEVEEPSTT